LSEDQHVLILLLDHIVSDWISNAILNREIWTLYEHAEQGVPFSLPVLPLQFADYAVWQQRTYDSWVKKHETYWKEHLAGAQLPKIPNDAGSKSADTTSPRGATIHIPFGRGLSDRLRSAARDEGTLLPVLVLTAFAVVLSDWCRQQDLVIPFISHGRYRRPELEPMIGYVSHWLYFRIRLSGSDTLGDLLGRVKHEFSQAFYHQDFDRVPDFLPEYAATYNFVSLHESLFQWRSASRIAASPHKQQQFGQVRTQPFLVRLFPDGGWKFLATFQDTAAGIFLTLYYLPDLLTSDTVQWFGTNVRLVVDALAERPHTTVRSATTQRR